MQPTYTNAPQLTNVPKLTHIANSMNHSTSTSQIMGLSKQVDKSDTDNVVNKFLKDLVLQGQRQIAAGGAWWGPEDKANENQLWVVRKNVGIFGIDR